MCSVLNVRERDAARGWLDVWRLGRACGQLQVGRLCVIVGQL